MDNSKVNIGDTFFEWDTSYLFVYSPTGWVEKNGTVQVDNGTVQLSGSILAEQKTQADAENNVITFAENITAIEIYHEEATWQT
ncbi:MAG: hypothetical protein PHT02_07110, partial [Tissierellia bacterium]|nr:hypothetical protein [Tissierellia bacterium]